MANTIKIRAKSKNDVVTVKVLVTHPMETGTRKDSKTKEVVPAHFIKELKAEAHGKVVFHGNIGTGVAKNPYFAFKFKGASAGDTIKISWVDNLGNSDSRDAVIK
ncbi:MAG: thiosulfate oxidation carrier complex protein SoxZ [Candidatus Tectomicrobia bacterium]|nr:thiosulfate oxidation carrier complex protein SoxZ [Candidatus Tectomicrobia bacterium]